MLRRAAVQDLRKIMYVFNDFLFEINENGIDEYKYDSLNEDDFLEEIESGKLYLRSVGTDIGGFISVDNTFDCNVEGIRWRRNTISTGFYRIIVNPKYKDKNIHNELILLSENISMTHRLNYVRGIIYEPHVFIIDELKKCNYNFVGNIYDGIRKHAFCCYDKIL